MSRCARRLTVLITVPVLHVGCRIPFSTAMTGPTTRRPAPSPAMPQDGTALPIADAPPATRRRTEHDGPMLAVQPPAAQAVPSAAPADTAGPSEPAPVAGAVGGTKRRRDEWLRAAPGEEGPAAPAARAAGGREEAPEATAASDEPAPKRARMEVSPERADPQAPARGAAALASPPSATRSGGSAGVLTRSGRSARADVAAPSSRPADGEFDRRQLHDLPRDVRTRLLNGAPLAVAEPITGAIQCHPLVV